jgi:hypothetical protein
LVINGFLKMSMVSLVDGGFGILVLPGTAVTGTQAEISVNIKTATIRLQ